MPMQLTAAKDSGWRPIRDGLELAPLNVRDGKGTFLLRFAPGACSPTHTHPGGEEIYVVSGRGRLDDLRFGPGDFIYTPPGEGHTLHAETEVVIHVLLPEPIVITE
jgi:quercetin dioxygenase-like cupin family protein